MKSCLLVLNGRGWWRGVFKKTANRKQLIDQQTADPLRPSNVQREKNRRVFTTHRLPVPTRTKNAAVY
ncbi:hypothetical protein ScPMuIL_017838 [Solemya velum]